MIKKYNFSSLIFQYDNDSLIDLVDKKFEEGVYSWISGDIVHGSWRSHVLA